ncbi:MAG: 4'-phosphopantetheinyl transferase family protein [Sciscionella sp.]
MMAEILPEVLAVVETRADVCEGVLLPAERAVIANAVHKRRTEFATVRWCARQAMVGLGVEPVAVLPGERRAPCWPAGVLGSMTHCAGYRAAALAREDDCIAVGIDAEVHAELPEGVLEAVSSRAERKHLAALGATHPEVHWDRLLFSAKESVYKSWFPITRRWLGFEDAELRFSSEDAGFTARLLPDQRPFDVLRGRWIVEQGVVCTAIALLRRDGGAGPERRGSARWRTASQTRGVRTSTRPPCEHRPRRYRVRG